MNLDTRRNDWKKNLFLNNPKYDNKGEITKMKPNKERIFCRSLYILINAFRAIKLAIRIAA